MILLDAVVSGKSAPFTWQTINGISISSIMIKSPQVVIPDLLRPLMISWGLAVVAAATLVLNSSNFSWREGSLWLPARDTDTLVVATFFPMVEIFLGGKEDGKNESLGERIKRIAPCFLLLLLG